MIENLTMMFAVDGVAQRSKDPSSKIGCILVTKSDLIFESNNLPRFVDTSRSERHQRPAKYMFYEHAERNSIFSAARLGISTEGSTMYTTGVPCADCSRAVIQAGVKKLIAWKTGAGITTRTLEPGMIDWGASCAVGREMLTEAGVEIVELDKP